MIGRLIFLGDSITDGHTLVLHVEQALEELNEKTICFNAGVSGDRADQMLARVSRDVLPLLGDKIFVNAGVNDAIKGIAPSSYRENLQRIISVIQESGSESVLVTPTALASEHMAAKTLIREYASVQRDLARENGLLIADVGAAMNAAKLSGASQLLAADGIHLEETGYTCMAAAILSVLGYPDAPLSIRPRWEPIQGLIRHWNLALKGAGVSLDHESGPSLVWTVPENEPCSGWWYEQERIRGYALSFSGSLPGSSWLADSVLPSGGAFTLSVGGHVLRVTVDDTVVYDEQEWRGWHMRPVSRIMESSYSRRLRLVVRGPFAAACNFDDHSK